MVGENGESCEMAALDDGTGYKILCAGDSVGVVLNGENGKSGENGESCDVSPLADGSGYKVVCDGDSIGVVLNGAKGDDGVKGDDGESCTLSDDGNGSVQVICAQDTATLYKAMCGKDAYDPAKNFCVNTGKKDSLIALCNGETYDFATQFCGSIEERDSIVALCDGKPYNLAAQFCGSIEDQNFIIKLCGGKTYDFATQFCGSIEEKDSIVELCNGNSYNLATQYCKKGSPNTVETMTFVTTEYLNQELLADGGYGVLLDERDGKVYRTIQIGTQTWMAQNLNYNYVKNNEDRTWCSGENNANTTTCETSGRLYLRDDSPAICPDGWKLPSMSEWKTLLKNVGWTDVASIDWTSADENTSVNADLKNVLLTASPETSWESYMKTGTDDFGFSVVPAGYRYQSGTIYSPTSRAYFMAVDWNYSSNTVHLVAVGNKGVSLFRYQDTGAYSVRCIKE